MSSLPAPREKGEDAMRVLLLAPVPPAAEGGGAIPVLLHAELQGLRARHEVTVVTAFGDEPWEAEAVEALRVSGLEVHVADRRQPPPGRRRWERRIRLARAWARGRRPWRTVWYADPALQEILAAFGAGDSFDVIAVEDSSMSVFELPAGVATVLTHHEVLRPRGVDWRAGPPWRWPRWALREADWRRWEEFQRAAWRRFDLVQVFSPRDAELLATLAPAMESRVRVDPFGLVLPEPADPGREVDGSLLFVGNFAHPPNRDAAAWLVEEIMPQVLSRFPTARLRLVGTAPTARVRALAGPRIEVIADAPTVRPYIEEAAVVLAPVRTGGGMRMKVLQAIAAGKALVTTPRGEEGYTHFDNSPPFLVAGDAPSFAAATASLLESPDRRAELGRRGREFAERNHSPSAWADRLTEIYEEARGRRESASHV
jgi:glycosyltransferase involved in cell wall biosynthesis